MANRVLYIVNISKIEELAKKRGLSLTKLESELDISHSTIVRWKKTGGRKATANAVRIVADYFGTSTDNLLKRYE